MKKAILAGAVCLASMAAQAISFKWGVDGNYTYFGTGNKTGGITLTLVYLGKSGSTYSINDFTVANPAATATSGTSTGTSQTTPPMLAGMFNAATYTAPAGAQIGSSASDVMTAGESTFGLVLTYNDGTDTWINIANGTYTVPAGSTDITTGLTHNFTVNWAKNDAGTPLTAGGGWTTVPEPGVACMALLGLGMLIKRRRA